MTCGWAHVLHAIYKPWGRKSPTYAIQHMSLFTTTFIFTMGLLFKVGGVSTDQGSYRFLTFVMLLLCISFALVWIVAMTKGVVVTLRRRRLLRKGLSNSLPAEDSEADVTAVEPERADGNIHATEHRHSEHDQKAIPAPFDQSDRAEVDDQDRRSRPSVLMLPDCADPAARSNTSASDAPDWRVNPLHTRLAHRASVLNPDTANDDMSRALASLPGATSVAAPGDRDGIIGRFGAAFGSLTGRSSQRWGGREPEPPGGLAQSAGALKFFRSTAGRSAVRRDGR